jgi:hypothetical protein
MTNAGESAAPTGRGVSVVVPARGRANLLERAILSALAQVGVEVEIIVVDDGSDPPLEGQLEARLLERVELLRNPVRRNAAYSRNLGAARARFPILAFLDSDDVWRRDHLATALGWLDRHGPDHLYVTPLRRRRGPVAPVDDPYAGLFGGGIDFRTSGFVCRRSLFDDIGGFDPLLEKHQDWDFALRAGVRRRLLLGSEATVRFDSDAAGRMSGRPNLQASIRLLDKHRAQMRPSQVARFLGGVVKAAALTRDPALLQQAKALAKDHLELSALPPKARLAVLCPPLFAGLTHAKRRAARLRRSVTNLGKGSTEGWRLDARRAPDPSR